MTLKAGCVLLLWAGCMVVVSVPGMLLASSAFGCKWSSTGEG